MVARITWLKPGVNEKTSHFKLNPCPSMVGVMFMAAGVPKNFGRLRILRAPLDNSCYESHASAVVWCRYYPSCRYPRNILFLFHASSLLGSLG